MNMHSYEFLDNLTHVLKNDNELDKQNAELQTERCDKFECEF